MGDVRGRGNAEGRGLLLDGAERICGRPPAFPSTPTRPRQAHLLLLGASNPPRQGTRPRREPRSKANEPPADLPFLFPGLNFLCGSGRGLTRLLFSALVLCRALVRYLHPAVAPRVQVMPRHSFTAPLPLTTLCETRNLHVDGKLGLDLLGRIQQVRVLHRDTS